MELGYVNVDQTDRQTLLGSGKRAWVRPDGHVVGIPDDLTHETYLMDFEDVPDARAAGWLRYHCGAEGSIFIDAPSPELGIRFLKASGLIFADTHITIFDYCTGNHWIRGPGGPEKRFFKPPAAHETETLWL